MHSSSSTSETLATSKEEVANKRAIYVGNLPPGGITETALFDIFSLPGDIKSLKVIDKSTLNATGSYAFVEYDDPAAAQEAIETMNGRTIQDSVIKVNWAFQSTSTANAREETASHFTIFVGDLATEIDDERLHAAFSNYLSISDARIMWDMTTGRSRGYGFVSFKERKDAEMAIDHMNGAQLGNRNIRTNWAKTKQSTPTTPAAIVGPGSAVLAQMSYQQLSVTQQYSLVLNQAPPNACTIYIGNLAADTTQADLDPLFGVYGDAEEIRLHVERGFAFAKLKTHDVAALAIVQLAGVIVKGRPIKCSWQCKSDANGKPRSLSNALPSVLPVFTKGSQKHSTFTPEVITPQELIGIQVYQHQQKLMDINNQIAAIQVSR